MLPNMCQALTHSHVVILLGSVTLSGHVHAWKCKHSMNMNMEHVNRCKGNEGSTKSTPPSYDTLPMLDSSAALAAAATPATTQQQPTYNPA